MTNDSPSGPSSPGPETPHSSGAAPAWMFVRNRAEAPPAAPKAEPPADLPPPPVPSTGWATPPPPVSSATPPVQSAAPLPPTPAGPAFPAAAYRAADPANENPIDQITLEPSRTVVTPLAILAATGIAFLGTLLWVVLVSTTSMRLMMLPWLIGAAVGYASMRAGGRGMLMGGLCALLILLFGLLGRLACVTASPDSFYVPPAVTKDMRLMAQTYEELADTMSAAYGMNDSVPGFESEEDLRWYIIDNGLTEATAPEEVTPAELRQWQNALNAKNPGGIEASHSELTALIEELDAAHPDTPLEIYSATLGPWDFIWIFFGMAAAFFIGGAREGSL